MPAPNGKSATKTATKPARRTSPKPASIGADDAEPDPTVNLAVLRGVASAPPETRVLRTRSVPVQPRCLSRSGTRPHGSKRSISTIRSSSSARCADGSSRPRPAPDRVWRSKRASWVGATIAADSTPRSDGPTRRSRVSRDRHVTRVRDDFRPGSGFSGRRPYNGCRSSGPPRIASGGPKAVRRRRK